MAIALALWALRLGGRRATTVILWLAIASTGCAMIPIGALAGAAHRAGAPISWVDHLRVSAPGPTAEPNQTLVFASVDGKILRADVYLPGKAGSATEASAPVVMIHGGGFVGGTRSMGRDWDRWLASRGYTVFDVDYRPRSAGDLESGRAGCGLRDGLGGVARRALQHCAGSNVDCRAIGGRRAGDAGRLRTGRWDGDVELRRRGAAARRRYLRCIRRTISRWPGI